MILTLQDGDLTVRVSPQGGALVDGYCQGVPFLRPAPVGEGVVEDILQAASFPLVPFGNRLGGNKFAVGGQTYHLPPNTTGNPLYLHGDGWLATWTVVSADEKDIRLSYVHPADGQSPYAYEAQQHIRLQDGALILDLSVTNRGDAALHFGLGHHPYFPRTPQTRLLAPAGVMWSEQPDHLPGAPAALPPDLDFHAAKLLPDRWVNNAFDGWDGMARIEWPERELAVVIDTDASLRHYMLYLPTDDTDFFCFEPMSHLPNGHHLPGLGGLVLLVPGESVAGRMRLQPQRLDL